MARFLIEIPHPEDELACAKAIKVLLTTGSHFLTHADWGCEDGDHHCWMIIDAESREEVKRIIPPAYRAEAKVVKLCKFTIEEIDSIISHHEKV